MSAGVCGKRLGLEEIFGSPAPGGASAKRARCARFGSPIRSPDFGFGSDDKVSVLLRMFPSMDREVIETVLKSHDHKIDDAIKSLNALRLGDGSARDDYLIATTLLPRDDHIIQDGTASQTTGEKVEELQNGCLDFSKSLPENRSSWVDTFVQEMMNASNWDDVRDRARKILEAFERDVLAHSAVTEEGHRVDQHEIAVLKDQLQCLLRENQILKRAVAIQHERNLEHEEKLKEVQQLKHIISQYQEQVRTLELNNYTLKIHLQRAQEANSIPNRFHPDIF